MSDLQTLREWLTENYVPAVRYPAAAPDSPDFHWKRGAAHTVKQVLAVIDQMQGGEESQDTP